MVNEMLRSLIRETLLVEESQQKERLKNDLRNKIDLLQTEFETEEKKFAERVATAEANPKKKKPQKTQKHVDLERRLNSALRDLQKISPKDFLSGVYKRPPPLEKELPLPDTTKVIHSIKNEASKGTIDWKPWRSLMADPQSDAEIRGRMKSVIKSPTLRGLIDTDIDAAIDQIFHMNKGTAGNGEILISLMFGAAVTNSGDFDITQGSTRWEVKEPHNGRIRLAAQGVAASADMRHEINTLYNSLVRFLKIYDESPELQGFIKAAQLSDAVSDVRQFVDDDLKMIYQKAEMTVPRLQAVSSMLEVVKDIKNALQGKPVSEFGEKNVVKVGNRELTVGPQTFAKILRALQQDQELDDLEIESGTTLGRVAFEAIEALDHPGFQDPENYADKLMSALDVTTTLPEKPVKVDGLILVNPKEFMIISRDKMSSKFDFDGLTQGGRVFLRLKHDEKPNPSTE